MIDFIIRRTIILIPLLFVISIISFVVIQLPPGDYLTTYVSGLEEQNIEVQQETIDNLRKKYGLGQSIYIQYYKWMRSILLEGDLGRSFQYNQPVADIIRDRLPKTVMISLSSIIFIWIVALPIGIYSATHQYSIFDYIFTFLGFIGLSLPNFLFALVLMWVIYTQFGVGIVGLFSREFSGEPWSIAKFIDLLKHIWLPMIVIGTAGTAGLIRVMRGNLLDEIGRQYVITGRAKGLKERILLLKYPVRVALNPVVSTIGWMIPQVVSGAVMVSIVLNLPTIGATLLQAIRAQDMYLAGSIVLILSTLTVIGTFISDLLLAILDPRIRYN